MQSICFLFDSGIFSQQWVFQPVIRWMDYRVVMNSQIFLVVNLFIGIVLSARINVNNKANVSRYKKDNDENKNNKKQEKWLVDFVSIDFQNISKIHKIK